MTRLATVPGIAIPVAPIQKKASDIDADMLAWSLGQPAVTRCALCPDWTFEGTAAAGRAAFLEHQAATHPHVRKARKRVKGIVGMAPSKDEIARREGRRKAQQLVELHERRADEGARGSPRPRGERGEEPKAASDAPGVSPEPASPVSQAAVPAAEPASSPGIEQDRLGRAPDDLPPSDAAKPQPDPLAIAEARAKAGIEEAA